MFVSGCDGGETAAPQKVVVGHAPLDGFVVMVRGSGNGGAIHLLDPETGKTSPTEIPVEGFSIAPDGSTLAWIVPGQGNADRRVQIGRPRLDGEIPVIDVLREWPIGQVFGLKYSALGDRLVGGTTIIDPETGATFGCGVHGEAGTSNDPLVVLPDGHRYACMVNGGLGYRLFDESGLLGSSLGGSLPLSPDGQVLGADGHIASLSYRDYDQTAGASWSAVSSWPLVDGRLVGSLVPRKHGEYVVSEAASGGFQTVYRRETELAPPPAGDLYALGEAFETGTWAPELAAWPMASALLPYFDTGDGRTYRALGPTADGEHLIYLVTSHIITQGTVPVTGSNPLFETPVDTALVAIARDGSARGLRTSELTDTFVIFEQPELLDLGPRGWLVSGFVPAVTGPARVMWVGFVDGEPTLLEDTDRVSADGGWLYGTVTREGVPHFCFRDIDKPATQYCQPQTTQGAIGGIVGLGLKASSSGAPVVTHVSRIAAPPGAEVVVRGASFGETPGEVRVGEVAVATADIVAWSNHAVTFRMSEALPPSGLVTVVNTSGSSGRHRAFGLGRTARVVSPFEGVGLEPIELRQGLQSVDLGAMPEEFTGNINDDYNAILPELREPDGHFLVMSQGAPTPTEQLVYVSVGGVQRALRFTLVEGRADDTIWQPMFGTRSPFEGDPAVTTLGGELIDLQKPAILRLGDRFENIPIKPRPATGGDRTLGLPDFAREVGLRTFVTLDLVGGTAIHRGWSLRELVGWDVADSTAKPVYANAPALTLPDHHRHCAGLDPMLVCTGLDPVGRSAYTVSLDQGATLEPTQVIAAEVLSAGVPLAEPIAVEATSPFVLAFEGSYNGGDIFGVHGITPEGAFVPDIAPVPPGARLPANSAARRTLEVMSLGGRVCVRFPETDTLFGIDFDAETPTWSVLPDAADAGRVGSLSRDATTSDLYAVRSDGSVMRSLASNGWDTWEPVDLGIALPHVRVVPRAVTRLDGRWVVAADWFDPESTPSDETRSLFGRRGWLLGPSSPTVSRSRASR